jgi:hypothetical protein
MATCCCDLERLCLFALVGYVNQLTRLYSERRSVNSLTVNKNVAVHYKLT